MVTLGHKVEEAVLEEAVFLTKRLRVLPVRRRRRKDTERLLGRVRTYFRRLAQRVPAKEMARQYRSRVQKQEDPLAGLLFREWMSGVGSETVLGLDVLLAEESAESFQHAIETYGDVQGLDIAFDLPREEAVEFLRQRGAERVRGIHDVTRRQLAGVLADGMEQGRSPDRVAKDIRRMAHGMARERALMIAQTETASAYGAAQEKLAEEVQAQSKEWLSANDSRVCDLCRANQDQGKIPKGQPFASGAVREPQHPTCRCTTLLEDLP